MSRSIARRAVLASVLGGALAGTGYASFRTLSVHGRRETELMEERSAKRAFEKAEAGELWSSVELVWSDFEAVDNTTTRIIGAVENQADALERRVGIAVRATAGDDVYGWFEIDVVPARRTEEFRGELDVAADEIESIETAIAHWHI